MSRELAGLRPGPYRVVLEAAEAAGCTLERTRRRVKVRAPGGTVAAALTPSRRDGWLDLSVQLLRAGVALWPPATTNTQRGGDQHEDDPDPHQRERRRRRR